MPNKKRNSNTKKERSYASNAGFHFYNLYQCCPMKFFIRYLLRLETKKISPPLITGTAFHEGKATFYRTHSLKKAVKKVETIIKDHEEHYYEKEYFEKDYLRFPLLLEIWIEQYGYKHLEDYEITGIEKELFVKVPNTENFIASARIDLIYKEKLTNNLYIHDTKTSSFSKKITNLGLYYGDQATMYIWAVAENYNQKPTALIGDIAYWNKNAKDEQNISCYQTDLIIRSDKQIEEFKQSLAAIFNEISQKVTAWKTGNYTKAMLFPRNTYYCNSFSKACEYADICRTNIEEKTRAPIGFIRVPKSKTKTLDTYTIDQITGE